MNIISKEINEVMNKMEIDTLAALQAQREQEFKCRKLQTCIDGLQIMVYCSTCKCKQRIRLPELRQSTNRGNSRRTTLSGQCAVCKKRTATICSKSIGEQLLLNKGE